MKPNDFYRISLIAMLFISMYACNSKSDSNEQLIGEWKAHWETSPNKNMQNIHGNKLSMNGLVKFMKDGKVEICAYGYEGCIFSDDTLKNMMRWKMDNSALQFMNSDAENGLSYNINKILTNEP